MKNVRTIAILLILFAAAEPLLARSPVPDFTGSRVQVSEVSDEFSPLLEEIAALESSSKRTYFVVVVNSAGDGPDAARDYLDEMHSKWKQQSAEQKLDFDPKQSVVVLLAINNRELAVRGGSLLQGRYGFQGERIDRELVQPYFISSAKAGDYVGGLKSLLLETDKWLVAREGGHPSAPPALDTAGRPPEPAAATRPLPSPTVKTQTRVHPAARGPGIMERLRQSLPVRKLLATAGAALAAVLAFFSARRFSRRRKKARELAEMFKAFSTRVVKLLESQEALKRRHQLLPYSDRDYKEPMAGDTLAVYEQTDRDIAKLRAEWLAMMDIHAQVEAILESGKRVSPSREAEVRKHLTVSERLAEADALHDRCVEQIDTLEQAHESAGPVLQEVKQALLHATRQVEAIGAANLATTPYEGEMNTARALSEQEEIILIPDPLGARHRLMEIKGRLATLASGTEQVLKVFEGAQRVTERLDDIATLAGTKRAEGLKLTEDEGNPDPAINLGRAEYDATLLALNRGEAEMAGRYLEQAVTWADLANEVINRQAEARGYCTRALPERREQAATLQAAQAEAQGKRGQLEQSFAKGSWSDIADNTNQGRRLTEELEPLIEQAAAAASDEVQHYFRAEDVLVHVEEQQEHIAALCEAVGNRLDELVHFRSRCLDGRVECTEKAREAREFLREHRTTVGIDVQRILDTAADLEKVAAGHMEEERPNWPLIRHQLDEALAGYGHVLDQAKEDVQFREELQTQHKSTTTKSEKVGRLLSKHTEDRPPANRAYQVALLNIEAVTDSLETPNTDWEQLVRKLKTADADLDKAERWARKDIQLARQAETEIADTQRVVTEARSYYRHGVSANVAVAESQLDEARNRFREQAYEDALQATADAQREAREAQDHAVREARVRRHRINERRMRQAAQALTTAASVFRSIPRAHGGRSVFGGTRGFGSRPTFPSRSWSRPSGTSSSSWSSGTSSSKW